MSQQFLLYRCKLGWTELYPGRTSPDLDVKVGNDNMVIVCPGWSFLSKHTTKLSPLRASELNLRLKHLILVVSSEGYPYNFPNRQDSLYMMLEVVIEDEFSFRRDECNISDFRTLKFIVIFCSMEYIPYDVYTISGIVVFSTFIVILFICFLIIV